MEGWHKETNSFHLPVGEMTITLDDVSCLLHLSITGGLYSYPIIDSNMVIDQLIDLLRITCGEGRIETSQCRGPL